MSKQRPNSDKMANELAGASAFFRPTVAKESPAADLVSTPPVAPSPPQTAPRRQPDPTPEAIKDARTPRTVDRPVKRQMIRHAFELYLDQLDSLRDLADAQRRRGEPASMSRMVREAIDQYLEDQSPTD